MIIINKQIKKIIAKISILAIPILCIMIYLEVNLMKIENNYHIKKQFIEEEIKDIDTIITGSSHTAFGINPDFLQDKVFVLAFPWQNLYYDDKLVLKYLKDMEKLRLAIITVSYPSLETGITRKNFYAYYYGIMSPNTMGWEIHPEKYSLLYVYGMRNSLELAFNGFKGLSEDFVVERNGFLHNKVEQQQELDDNYGRGVLMGMKEKYIKENVESIEEMIRALQERNIAVVIITIPQFYKYTDKLDAEKYGRMQGNINYLCNKYSVEYHNYLFDKRFTAEDFRDIAHLNPQGAKKFSEIINKDIIKPNLCL